MNSTQQSSLKLIQKPQKAMWNKLTFAKW